MPTATVLSSRTTQSGTIYDVGGSKTAFPQTTDNESGQTNSGSPDEAYRCFFFFPTANVVPVGGVVTQVIWKANLVGPQTSTLGVNITHQMWGGQTYTESPLATSDWADGYFMTEYAGGLAQDLEIDLEFAPGVFDPTLDFTMGVWDVSTHDTDPNFDVYVDLYNGLINSRKQTLYLVYTLGGPKVFWTFGG